MNEHVDRLIEKVLETNMPLELIVKIDDSLRRDPALGTDLEALDSVWFTGAVAEFIDSYARYLGGRKDGLPYSPEAFRDFEGLWSTRIGARSRPYMAPNDAEVCRALFRAQMHHRSGGYWNAASSDILRVELIEIWKENPSFRKILAKGTMSAAVFCALFFGAAIVTGDDLNESASKQIECQQRILDYGDRQLAILANSGKFEGKLSVEAYSKLQSTVAAGIAACAPGREVIIEVTSNGFVIKQWVGKRGL